MRSQEWVPFSSPPLALLLEAYLSHAVTPMSLIKKMRFPFPNSRGWVAEAPSRCAYSLTRIRRSERLDLCPRDAKCGHSFCTNLLTFTLVVGCSSVVFLWAAQEACRHTLVINGDRALLAFKIAFLCNNWENLQGFSWGQTFKQHVSCWAVRVIYIHVYIYVCLYRLFFPLLLSDTWVRAGSEMSRKAVLSSWRWGAGPGGEAARWLCAGGSACLEPEVPQ